MEKTYKKLNIKDEEGRDLYEEIITIRKQVTLEEKQQCVDDCLFEKQDADKKVVGLQSEIELINNAK